MRAILKILILGTIIGCSSETSEITDISEENEMAETSIPQKEELQKIIDNMVEYGEYTGSAVGYSGSKPTQWDNFTTLMKTATNEELRTITDHESPVVRSYSFKALCLKSDSTVLNILLNHLHDTAFVNTRFGCIGDRELVGDLYLDEYEWMIMRDSSTFESKKSEIDSILIFTPGIKLYSRNWILSDLELSNSLYPRLKEILITEEEPEALVAVSKYQKEVDRELIMKFLNKSDKYDIEYGLRAVIEFPDIQFYQTLKKIQMDEIDRDGGFDYPFLRYLYQAFVQYKTTDCKDFLLKTIEETDGSTKKYHSQYIWLALQIFPDPVFQEVEANLEVDDVSKDMMSHWIPREE